MSKLVLGTVQFGCQYGINSAGRPDESSVRDILAEAEKGGISTLDTSSAYGDAEQVLGRSLEATGCRFNVVSKYPKGSGPVDEVFERSLSRLGSRSLYGYLLHHFELFLADRKVWRSFLDLRESGKVERIGFSIYNTEELELLLRENVDFSLVQFQRNIFDRRFDKYLEELKARGVEVHVRSTFLQGLFFKDRATLPDRIKPLGKYLAELDDYSARTGIGIPELALGFNSQNPCIDGVLIGVDNRRQLLDNLAAGTCKHIDLDINVREQELLSPVNWK